MQTVKSYDESYSGDSGAGYVVPLGAAALPDTGVTEGSYGLAGSIPTFTVDAKGRVSTVVNVPISITQAQVVNLTGDLALKAPLASPPLTGIPTAPTAAPGTNTTQIATTAHVLASVAAAVAALVASSPATLDTLKELATALGNDPNFATTIATSLGLKQNSATAIHTGNIAAQAVSSAASAGTLSGTAQAIAATWSNVQSFSSGVNIGGGSANLSKYDEGTWTPTAVGLGGSGIAYSAKWIRIGNMISYAIYITGTGLVASLGTTTLSLPFTSARNYMPATVYLPAVGTSAVGTVQGNIILLPAISSTTIISIAGFFFLN